DYDWICDPVTITYTPEGLFDDMPTQYLAGVVMQHHEGDSPGDAGALSIRSFLEAYRLTNFATGVPIPCGLVGASSETAIMACSYGTTFDANGLMEYSESQDRWYLSACTLSKVLSLMGGPAPL